MDRKTEATDLTRAEVVQLLRTEKEKLGSWRALSYKAGCIAEDLSRIDKGGYIPLAAASYLGLERIEIRTVVYRRKLK